MPGRKYAAGSLYRYGFNGKENDNEVDGEGGQQDYGMRIYDPKIGRFLSVDPLFKNYPFLTTYQFASNRPIDGIDLDGNEYASSRESFFKMFSGQVEIQAANLPSVLKDNVGRPLFNAMGVGLTPLGKIASPSNCVEMREAGINNIPSMPKWAFALKYSDMPSDLWSWANGSKNYSLTPTGPGMIANTSSGVLHSFSNITTAWDEIIKYGQLYNDVEQWTANSHLQGQVYTFDLVIKTVDSYINAPGGLNSVESFKNSEFSRDQLINFVMDGSLPAVSQDNGDLFSIDRLRRDANIMFYGLQIIDQNAGTSTNGRTPGMLPWQNTYYRVNVSTESINRFRSAIEGLKIRYEMGKEERLGAYSELLEKLENENK